MLLTAGICSSEQAPTTADQADPGTPDKDCCAPMCVLLPSLPLYTTPHPTTVLELHRACTHWVLGSDFCNGFMNDRTRRHCARRRCINGIWSTSACLRGMQQRRGNCIGTRCSPTLYARLRSNVWRGPLLHRQRSKSHLAKTSSLHVAGLVLPL
jgi:hypothetical protein